MSASDALPTVRFDAADPEEPNTGSSFGGVQFASSARIFG
jgi:hypothetical protein